MIRLEFHNGLNQNVFSALMIIDLGFPTPPVWGNWSYMPMMMIGKRDFSNCYYVGWLMRAVVVVVEWLRMRKMMRDRHYH